MSSTPNLFCMTTELIFNCIIFLGNYLSNSCISFANFINSLILLRVAGKQGLVDMIDFISIFFTSFFFMCINFGGA